MGGGSTRNNASIQAFFPPTPTPSPTKPSTTSYPTSGTPIGDGFTADEVREALKPKPVEPWHPPTEYADCEIRDLYPGPRTVTFMGRVANIFDVANSPKTPRSAKGCFKLCIKDDKGAVTVRLWYATHAYNLRLGSLVSIWTNHERDRNCHLMVHENSDNGSMCRTPLGYREGRPMNGVMTLQNFIDGGYDVIDAKILLVVKSIGVRKKVTRKDESTVENANLQVHDDTAEAILGLWGTSALTPAGTLSDSDYESGKPEAVLSKQPWKAGETVLLLQAPGWKIGHNTYLKLTSATIIDIDPAIPDADWLRKWSQRQKCREAINPAFPGNIFDLEGVLTGPIRCLYNLADLDEFARAAPAETFQGFLSVMILESKLLDCWKRGMLCSGECCNMALYANATTAKCKGCEKVVQLRLSPRILGQVVDETGVVSSGKLLLSDKAWGELLGRGAEDLFKLGYDGIKYLSDRLLFCRITLIFGWTGDESKAGGRICVMGVRS